MLGIIFIGLDSPSIKEFAWCLLGNCLQAVAAKWLIHKWWISLWSRLCAFGVCRGARRRLEGKGQDGSLDGKEREKKKGHGERLLIGKKLSLGVFTKDTAAEVSGVD